MSRVHVVTDSTASIPPQVAAALDIAVVPAFVNFQTESYRDGVDLTPTEFYAKLAVSPALPTTAVPAPGVFEEIYRRLGATSRDIVSIHIAAKLSGMLNAATAAARALPDLNIALVDSRTISMALGWLAILAARAARAGCSQAEIVARVQAATSRTWLIAVLDTLEYLRRSGRITLPQAFVGTLLDIKPIREVLPDDVHPLEKVRTRRRANARAVELAARHAPFEELAVLHTNAPARAEEVRTQLATLHPLERILVAEAGPILGTHVGPGGVGIAGIVAERHDRQMVKNGV